MVTANWLDTGCRLSPSCLACPLPQCKHDLPYWRQREQQTRLPVALALPLAEAARALGVTERTVHRIRARGRQASGE